MAENTSTFTGAAADGTALTAVYLTQPAANVAIGLVFAGSDLPRIVHLGRPLAPVACWLPPGAPRWPSPTPCWPPMTP